MLQLSLNKPALVRPFLNYPILHQVGEQEIEGFPIGWALDLVRQNSTFTCAATARTCWGYVGDPSAANPPQLITGIGANVDAIVGGRWVVADSRFYTTATTGATLNPYTLKSTPSGTVKVFTAYASRANTTAYALGVELALLTDAGNRVMVLCTKAGTTAGAQPSYTDSDIGGAAVADGTAEFSVQSYATGLAEQLEGPSENLSPESETVNTWANNNEVTIAADNITAPDGTLTADKITGNAGDLIKRAAQFEATADASDYTIKVFGKYGTHQFIQFPLVNNGAVYANFDLVNGTTAVFGATASSKITLYPDGYYLCEMTWTGSATVSAGAVIMADSLAHARNATTTSVGYFYLWGMQIENAGFGSSYIPTITTTLARAATRLLDTTAGRMSAASWGIKWVGTPIGAGQVHTLISTYVDANNYTAIITTATQVILRERVGGVDTDTTETYTHLAGVPMEVHAKHDGVKSYVRAFSVGDATPAYAETAYTTDSQIGTNFEDCSLNNTDHFSANNTSFEMDITPANLGI